MKKYLLDSFQLNPEQRVAATHKDGPLEIVAGPGTGKTHTIVARAVNLIDQGVKPHQICIVTFTNKAAAELKDRVAKYVGAKGQKMVASTFHGLGLRILYSILSKQGKTKNRMPIVLDEGEAPRLLKNHIIENRPDLLPNNDATKIDFPRIVETYNRAREAGFSSRINVIGRLGFRNVNNQKFRELICEYEKIKDTYFAFDFTDLLYCIVNSPYRNQMRFRFTHVMVDEAHDMNRIQLEMARMLAGKNLCIISDEDQCQPGDTEVLTFNGYKRMDQLDPESDRIVSFISKENRVGGFRNGFKFDVASRVYTGWKFEISCDGKKTICTSNHKWLVRWNEEAKNKNIVYLMKKGDNYRIGWCQLIRSDGSFHLGTRARIEQADAAWVLRVCSSKQEASKWESILSTKYSIPAIMLVPNGKTYYNEEVIDEIFDRVKYEMCIGVEHLFNDLRLNKEYPLWSKGTAFGKQDGVQRFKVQAANLIPGIMDIPIHTEGQKSYWKTIQEVRSKHTEDEIVYSLDVKVGADHDPNSKTYICNGGLITCNSIYEWRGANPKNIEIFRKLYPTNQRVILNRNYRSTQQIIDTTTNLIRHNKNRVEKHLISIPGEGPEHHIVGFRNAEDEAVWLGTKAKELNEEHNIPFDQIAILVRANQQSLLIEKELTKLGLSVKVQDGRSIFTRASVKTLVAYISFIVDPQNDYLFEKIINEPPNGIGARTLQKIREYKESISRNMSYWTLLVEHTIDEIPVPQSARDTLRAFYRVLCNVIPGTEPSNYASTMYYTRNIRRVINIRYISDLDLKEQQIVLGVLDDMSSMVSAGSSVEEWLFNMYLASSGDVEANDSCINIYTMHAAKGLEFEAVFVAGMENSICPWKMRAIPQERKLAYVAMTRAKRHLYITYADRRFISGKSQLTGKSLFVEQTESRKTNESNPKIPIPTEM